MSKKRTTKKPITDALRKAIAESGVSMLALSRETGIARASLIRFRRGETSLRLDVADRLMVYFGMNVSWPERDDV